MTEKREYKYLEKYLAEIQADGKLYFTIDDLKEKFSNYSLNSLRMNLKRLNKKRMIKFIMSGFYVIIPPEFSRQKMLPLELFIDALFNYLGRSYYVGLLSAAFYHGASHQQPQEFFVMINKPPMRNNNAGGLKINYMVNSDLANSNIEDKKTASGYMKISTPEQTAIDLIKFQSRIGGLNRVSTILSELAGTLEKKNLKNILSLSHPYAVLQRFGFLFDKILNKKDLADVIGNYLESKRIFRVPLKAGQKKAGFPVDPKWKIIENTNIEIDF